MTEETMNTCLEFGGDLLGDEAGQDVHDEAAQSRVHGEGLDDGAHEQYGEGALLHQLLHHHRQHLGRVHVFLPKAQVGGCSRDTDNATESDQLTTKNIYNRQLLMWLHYYPV